MRNLLDQLKTGIRHDLAVLWKCLRIALLVWILALVSALALGSVVGLFKRMADPDCCPCGVQFTETDQQKLNELVRKLSGMDAPATAHTSAPVAVSDSSSPN
jgi:hypothetical protein